MITSFPTTLAALLCAITLCMQLSCGQESYRVKLSDAVTVRNEWLEFHPQSSLKADKDIQMVVLDLESPFKYDFYKEGVGPNSGMGILMPDGEVINPEIEIIDQDGNKFNLVWSGARQTFSPVYSLPHPNQLPRDREYKTVRIRSPRPIKCKVIYWFCESAKDWK